MERADAGTSLAAATGDLRVVVHDGHGGPLAGLDVSVHSRAGIRSWVDRLLTTDGAGRCETAELPAGAITVNVRRGSLRRTVSAHVVAGRVQEVRVGLEAGASVSGVVRHLERGPLAGVMVEIGGRAGREKASADYRDFLTATTDADGRYELESVPLGVHEVAIKGEVVGYHPRARAALEIPSPAAVVRDFEVGQVSLEGFVREAGSGRPIAGARVQIQKPHFVHATSDAQGAYRFVDVPPGDYQVCVTHPGHELLFLRSGAVADEGAVRLDIELRVAATLAIEVVDTSGTPVQGDMTLSIVDRDPEKPGAVGAGIRTDADGRTDYAKIVPGEYRRIVPGRYSVRVSVEGKGAATLDTEVVHGDNALDFQLE